MVYFPPSVFSFACFCTKFSFISTKREMAAPGTSPLGKIMVVAGMDFVGYHVGKMLVQRYQIDANFIVDLHVSVDIHQLESNPTARICYYQADITNLYELQLVFKKTHPLVVTHTASPLPQVDTVSTKVSSVCVVSARLSAQKNKYRIPDLEQLSRTSTVSAL